MLTLSMGIPFKKSKGGILIKVKVQPRSSQRGISGIVGDMLKIKVHAPPIAGAANEELVQILSNEFGIKKTNIKIVTGHSSREKVIELKGISEDSILLLDE